MAGTAGLHIMLLAHKLSLLGNVERPGEDRLGTLLRQRCSEIIPMSPPHAHGAAAAYWTAVKKGLFA